MVVLVGVTCPAMTVGTVMLRALDRVCERALGLLGYGCSTVVLVGVTCPAMTVGTVMSRALDRVREGYGCFTVVFW